MNSPRAWLIGHATRGAEKIQPRPGRHGAGQFRAHKQRPAREAFTQIFVEFGWSSIAEVVPILPRKSGAPTRLAHCLSAEPLTSCFVVMGHPIFSTASSLWLKETLVNP